MSGLYEAASRGLELQLPATLFGNFSELFREVYPAHMVAAGIADKIMLIKWYGEHLNFSTPIVAIFVLRKFHYD